ncbi:hypothetical protein D3C73_715840 [compost metagenome]
MQAYGGNGGVTAGPTDIGGDISGAAIAIAATGGQLPRQAGGQGHGGDCDGEPASIEGGVGDGDQDGRTLTVQGAGDGGCARDDGGDQSGVQTHGGNGGGIAHPADIGSDVSGGAVAIGPAGGQLTRQARSQSQWRHSDGQAAGVERGIGNCDQQGCTLTIQGARDDGYARGDGGNQPALADIRNGRVIAAPLDAGGDIDCRAVAEGPVGGKLAGEAGSQCHGRYRDGESTGIEGCVGDGDLDGCTLAVQDAGDGGAAGGDSGDQTGQADGGDGGITAAPLDTGRDVRTGTIAVGSAGCQLTAQSRSQGQGRYCDGEPIRFESGVGDCDQKRGALAIQGTGEGGRAWGNGSDQAGQADGGDAGITAAPVNVVGDIPDGAVAVGAAGGKLPCQAGGQGHGRNRDGEPSRFQGGIGDLQHDGVADNILEAGRDDGIPFGDSRHLALQIYGGDADIRAVPVDLAGNIL